MKTGMQGCSCFFHSIGDGGIVKVFDNQQTVSIRGVPGLIKDFGPILFL